MRKRTMQVLGSIVLLCLSSMSYAEDVRAPRETSKKLELVDGKSSFYVKPPVVQAGIYPQFVGEVFLPPSQKYPGLLDLKDANSLQVAKELSTIDGVNRHISSFLPAGWDAIKGVPLAFIQNDLLDAGYSGGFKDAGTGMLDLFRIQLSTPEHETEFPLELILVVDFAKGDRQETLMIDMISDHRDGVYRFLSDDLVYTELGDMATEFGARRGFTDDPTKMRLSKLTGFDAEASIKDLPPIKGAMLIHHVYIGSYRVVSGWQWAGRPEGLHGSQQPGFVQ